MTELTAERFEAAIGKVLHVTTVAGDEAWTIERVERREPHALRADPPFNLYLTAPATQANRSQGIRRARFDDGETFEFFAVPIAANATAISFEVIFN